MKQNLYLQLFNVKLADVSIIIHIVAVRITMITDNTILCIVISLIIYVAIHKLFKSIINLLSLVSSNSYVYR